MSDGTETLDQIAPGAPASEEVETNVQPTDDYSDDSEQDLEAEDGPTDEDDGSSDDEEEELDLNGKKVRINKALKPLLMMQQDYTRKTQEVAEARKALEARQAEIEQQAKAVAELNDDRKKLVLIDDYIERQSKVDWNRLWQEDPLDTPRKWAEFQHWQGQREKLNSKIAEAEAQRAEVAQLDRAKRLQEAEETASKIKGWTVETGNKVAAQVQTYGFSSEEISDMVARYGGKAVKLAHAAFLGEQIRQKQQAATRTPTAQQEPPKPLVNIGKGKAPARSGLSDSMSATDWVKERERQLRNRK